MAVSLCDKHSSGRPRAGGQGQSKALVGKVSRLQCQQVWRVGSETLAPTLWEMKLVHLQLPRPF